MTAQDINATYFDDEGFIDLLLRSYAHQQKNDEIKQLVQNTEDINQSDFNGRKPLNNLVMFRVRADIIHLAITKGAEIEHKDVYTHETALFTAVCHEHEEAVKVLLSYGADPNTTSDTFTYESFPLYEACALGNYKIVDLLINNRANVNQKKKTGETALYVSTCKDNAEIASLLLNHGAIPFNQADIKDPHREVVANHHASSSNSIF